MNEYDGLQIVGIDLHRRRSVIVRMSAAGDRLDTVRIDNDPVPLKSEIAKAGAAPDVVLEARMLSVRRRDGRGQVATEAVQRPGIGLG